MWRLPGQSSQNSVAYLLPEHRALVLMEQRMSYEVILLAFGEMRNGFSVHGEHAWKDGSDRLSSKGCES